MTRRVRRAALAGVLAAGLVAVAGPSASPAGPPDSAVGIALVAGRLEIIGSPGPDAVSVRLDQAGAALEIFTRSTSVPDLRVRRADVTWGIEASLGSGDDTFSVTETGGADPFVVPMAIAGGEGADHLVGGAGGETLRGGPGPDLIEGRGGPDQIILGSGDDTVVWTADDGDDIADGGSGSDHAVIHGAATGDLLEVFEVGGGVSVSPGSSTTAQFWNVESLAVAPLTGSDKVVLGDLSGTRVSDVVVDLAPTMGSGLPDHILDTLEIRGTNGADRLNLAGSAGSVELTGLSASLHLRNADPRFPHDDSDLLAVRTQTKATGEMDVVTAFGLSSDAIRFVVGQPA